jgi:septation ring formation regulator EzrA
MMTLQDVLKAVDQLSPDELRELRAYLDQREGTPHPTEELSAETRARRLDAAVEALREGLTQAELDEMTAAMNAERV